MTQAAETLAIKVPKGTHFNKPDFPKPRPFNRAKNHLIQTPNGPTRQASHSWASLLPLLNSYFVNASVDKGDTISRIDGDTGETLFVATGSWKQRPSSAMGTTIPLSAALSADKASLPLPLYLLLQSALSPISPASETDSFPSSFSSCSEKENDKLRELIRIEQELLVCAKDPLLLSSDSLFPWSMVAFHKLLDLQLLQLKIYCSFNQQDGMTIRIMEMGAL
nr:hypothetical protein Iba_chr13cCG5900 [Ipomoea batatas]